MAKKSFSNRSSFTSTLMPETSGPVPLLLQLQKMNVSNETHAIFFIVSKRNKIVNVAKITEPISKFLSSHSRFSEEMPLARGSGVNLQYEDRFSAAELSYWKF